MMMFKKKRKIPKNNSNNLFYFSTIVVVFTILFLSVGFSAFQNDLAIEDISATVRIDKDIRVMKVSVDSVNEATSYHENYNVSNISGSISLTNGDSYVIYDVEVYNLGNVIMGIRDASIDNENLKFEFLDYNLKDKICENNQCSLGVKKTLKIKVSYKENAIINNENENFVLNFKFGRIYNIDYVDIPNGNSLPKEVIEGDTLNLNVINNIDGDLFVFMNNKRLLINSEYQYVDKILTIPNISGDIRIILNKYVCKRAVVLHTEECTQTDATNNCSGAGYTSEGSKGTSTITYGNLGTSGTLTSGDAFDCDVNGDGVYDSEKERFYYVSDYYNTSSKSFEDDTAVLIYYSNVSAGNSSNTKNYAYDTSRENWHGPRTAEEQLPTTSQWTNVRLKNDERSIITNAGGNTTTGGTTPSNFSYSGCAARLLTIQELRKGIGITSIPTWKVGELDNFTYLLERTIFSSKSNSTYAWWLETPRSDHSTNVWIVYGYRRYVYNSPVSRPGDYGVRPVIEVSKKDISY